MPKPGWTAGLGELVRAHRAYTGLSQRAFAEEIGIREQSLVDIETGRRDTPDGLLDTIAGVIERFDDEVTQCERQAEKMLNSTDPGDGSTGTVNFTVSEKLGDEWVRAVIGRAAVLGGKITPILPAALERAP